MKYLSRYKVFLGLLLTASVAFGAIEHGNQVIKGNLTVGGSTTLGAATSTQFTADNLRLDGNTISTTNTNGDLTFDLNGTGSLIFTDLTASTVPYLDASKKLTSSAVTPTQMGYVANATSNICGISQTCTLSGKTLTDPIIDIFNLTEQSSTPSTPSAGTKKLYAKNDGKLYTLNSSGDEEEVGTGAGGSGGGINFIINPDAESVALGTTGWNVYADSASATPTDGTGGTPTVTLTRNTSNPLRGTGDFKFSKDSADRQGEGFSTDFSVDTQDTENVSKPIFISFDYITGSSFTQGDLKLFIKDLSGSLITPKCGDGTNTLIATNALPSVMTCYFYTVSGHKSYRLIGHIATTNATDWSVWFDTVKATPVEFLPGAIVTDWVSYTPVGSFTSNVTYTGKWRRVGDSMEVMTKIAFSGAPNAVQLSINLPSGYEIDTSKVNSTTGGESSFGVARGQDSGIAGYPGVVWYFSKTTVGIMGAASTGQTWSNTIPFSWNSGDNLDVNFKVPISGWSSGNFMSNQALHAQTPKVVSFTSSTKTPSGTGQYHALTGNSITLGPGTYRLLGSCEFSASGAPGYTNVGCGWFSANGADNGTIPSPITGMTGVTVNTSGVYSDVQTFFTPRADYGNGPVPEVEVTVTGSSATFYLVTYAGLTTAANARIKVFPQYKKLTDSSVYGAYNGPEVAASYCLASGVSGSSSAPYNFATKIYDTQNSVTTGSNWKFSVTYPGKYQIDLVALASSGNATVGVYKNGSSVRALTSVTTTAFAHGTITIPIAASDYIDIRPAASQTLFNDPSVCVDIRRVGN